MCNIVFRLFWKGSCSVVSLSVKLVKKVWNWKYWLYCYLEMIFSYKAELDLRITIKWIIFIIEGTQGLQVFRMQCINFLLRRLINLCCRNWFTNWKGNKNKNQVLFSRIYNYEWAYSCLIIVLHLLLIKCMYIVLLLENKNKNCKEMSPVMWQLSYVVVR